MLGQVSSAVQYAQQHGLPQRDGMRTVWASSAGTTAQTHYGAYTASATVVAKLTRRADKSHNFVLQVLGSKRWLLTPPDFHDTLYLYPEVATTTTTT